MKYCEDCKYCNPGELSSGKLHSLKFAECLKFPTVPDIRYDLVTRLAATPPVYQTCALQRSRTDIGSCGPEGKLWEAKDGERSLES